MKTLVGGNHLFLLPLNVAIIGNLIRGFMLIGIVFKPYFLSSSEEKIQFVNSHIKKYDL